MKFILLCLLSFSSAAAFASQPIKTLECLSKEDFRGNFGAKLDPNSFDVGSGFYGISEAAISFEYSSAELICSGNTPDKLNCIGYWNQQGEDIAQVHTFKDASGQLSAHFTTSKGYGKIPVTLSCTIK